MRLLMLLLLLSNVSFAADRKKIRSIAERNTFVIFNLETQGRGSAFAVIDQKGNMRFITNAHVCYGGKRMYAYEYESTMNVIKVDDKKDLCEFTAPYTFSGNGLRIGKNPRIGDSVHVSGYPAHSRGNFVMTDGEIYAKVNNARSCDDTLTRCTETTALATTAMSGFGGSGGSAVNDNGELVGIVFSIHPFAPMANVGFAHVIDITILKEFLK